MNKLTAKQSEILSYIKQFISQYGFSPTIRDIGSYYNMSPNGAYRHIKSIENKGYIVRNGKGAARSIIIPENKIIVDASVIEKNKFYDTIKDKMKDLPKGKKCIICGTTKKIQRHHEDYNYPEITIDLCLKHHRQLHKIKNILSRSGYKFTIKK